ncbi:tryptophan 2,3-dioxygenase [Microlunatus phosphovorus NM-1]|uniref:Tryptophan 2,3-dioxygenase n=1 Tax=Microlunatus phosphovorus (strain ATCC 700054 / DSM 10555 / JCM 9379 / NBRC 101784 / NCIMB 13414 / VKM Ac-1990 / NM-1) TaxID=1032480 RepID=F5XJL5_MICPN|nr:tryptophan 2,3-dioxygenase family protein [Microlunatus phosphovorus]BAK35915.1 tryptophan 2,3-dioxygenase [Microlunatus phosphovorus NM-1]
MTDSEDARQSVRELEDSIRTDLRDALTYGGYLDLDRLLHAQHPRSSPEHHDELLFIVQHQTSELWLKLALHELRAARQDLVDDHLEHALKCLARVKNIQRTLIEQWSVLATLTPREYAEFRDSLANASGFQSFQYRAIEFVLGNKNARMLELFVADPEAHALLTKLLEEPTLYDAFLGLLARSGYPVPEEILTRDHREPWRFQPALVPIFRRIYESTEAPWGLYEACESLVDVEDNFQLWRFRHLRTVQRTIGFKTGTGGSSGVGFLRKALDLTFFPELYAVRTEIGT